MTIHRTNSTWRTFLTAGAGLFLTALATLMAWRVENLAIIQIHVRDLPLYLDAACETSRLALAFGLLTTTLLALAVHLGQKAHWRARELELENYERRQFEAALKQSEALHRTLIENLQQGVFLKDREGRFIAANKTYCRSIGRSVDEVIGRTAADVIEEADAADQAREERQVMADGLKIEADYEWIIDERKTTIRRALTRVHDESGRPIGVLGICWDVTEQRLVEARLRQACKMDAIGQLAGGIAHDFNNLLTTIVGNLDLLQDRLSPGDDSHELALAAQDAARRATTLTNRLMGFARQHHLDWEPIDVNFVIGEVVAFLGRTIDPRIRIETRLCAGIWLVQADAEQINQMLMNLCINARDAITGAGKIVIETSCVDVNDLQALHSSDARLGSFIRLRVTDTGCGMTSAVRAHIYEPFFTTKEVGKGTGLGLAMAFAIVRQHQGWIECESRVNCGTQFDIYLPRTAITLKPTPVPMPTPMLTRRGHETILIADDEPMIRRLAVLVLQKFGYSVLEAQDGQQALEIYHRQHKQIDLVLLDLTMPNVSGQEAFRKMRQINPRVKAIFASGYAAEQVPQDEQELIRGFIKKPYRPDDLIQAVQDALRSSASKQPALTMA